MPSDTILDRFMAKVVSNGDDDCWTWEAAIGSKGYGLFWPETKKTTLAHRWSYEQFVGSIPQGLQIDHTCSNRACVNPDHLEAVTCRENLMRGNTHAARNAAKTHCPKGHAYDEANTYITKRGTRWCRACARERQREKKGSK